MTAGAAGSADRGPADESTPGAGDGVDRTGTPGMAWSGFVRDLRRTARSASLSIAPQVSSDPSADQAPDPAREEELLIEGIVRRDAIWSASVELPDDLMDFLR